MARRPAGSVPSLVHHKPSGGEGLGRLGAALAGHWAANQSDTRCFSPRASIASRRHPKRWKPGFSEARDRELGNRSCFSLSRGATCLRVISGGAVTGDVRSTPSFRTLIPYWHFRRASATQAEGPAEWRSPAVRVGHSSSRRVSVGWRSTRDSTTPTCRPDSRSSCPDRC